MPPFRLLLTLYLLSSLICGSPLVAQEPAGQQKSESTEESIDIEATYQAGVASIDLEDWDRAVETLETVVQAEPENAKFHYALSAAYLGKRNFKAGFFHNREAIALDPSFKQAVADFLRLWKLFDASGLFNVGTPMEQVIAQIGQPNQRSEQRGKARLIYGFMSLNFVNQQLYSVLDLRNLPKKGIDLDDGLAYELPIEWQAAYRVYSTQHCNTEYVIPPQTVQDWNRLFSSQRYLGAASQRTAQELKDLLISQLEGRFENVEIEVLGDQPDDVMFTWKATMGEQQFTQAEIVRIVKGENDIHRLAYSHKGEMTDDAEWSAMAEIIQSAELLPAEALSKFKRRQMRSRRFINLMHEVLTKQQKHIRNRDIEQLRQYFSTELREQITPELLDQIDHDSFEVDVNQIARRVEIDDDAEPRKAYIYGTGDQPTIRLTIEGKAWYADNLWFSTSTEQDEQASRDTSTTAASGSPE